MKTRLYLLAISFILILAFACSDNIVSDCEVCSDDLVRGELTTFSDIQQTVFDVSCVSCHSGASASAGLDLSEGSAYQNLVNIPSNGSNLDLVEPFNSSESYLVKVLEGTEAPLMPPGARLSQATIDSVKSWIDRGAPND